MTLRLSESGTLLPIRYELAVSLLSTGHEPHMMARRAVRFNSDVTYTSGYFNSTRQLQPVPQVLKGAMEMIPGEY